MLRWLRIAFSIVCGIVCLLVIVLCVRSYRNLDELSTQISSTRGIYIESKAGRLSFFFYHWEGNGNWQSYRRSRAVEDYMLMDRGAHFQLRSITAGFSTLAAPHWFYIASAAALATAPWLPRRYSLRTLLVVMTLVALGLGAIVWAVR